MLLFKKSTVPIDFIAIEFAACICLSVMFVVAACAKDSPAAATGTIKGTVRLRGNPPALAPLKITKDQDVCREVPNEALLVSAGGGVQNTVVVLEGLPKRTPAPDAVRPVFRLTNWQCRFAPHVSVMQVDSDLEISNLDPILHTAKALQPQVNVGLYPGRAVRRGIGSPVLGPLKITCEVHPWMLAYVFLTDNAYYAVTDLHGEYQIEGVPPGKYRLKIWHELLGTQVMPVEVMTGKTAEVNVTLSAASR